MGLALEKKGKYGINTKVVVLGIATFAGFLYISSYSHEFGHIAICTAYGFTSELHISPYTFDTRASTCHGHPDNSLLFWSMGGVSGFVVSMAPAVFLRKYKFIIIGCLPNAIVNVIAGIMETFLHDWYISNTGGMPVVITFGSMLTVGTFLLLRYAIVSSVKLQPQPER